MWQLAILLVPALFIYISCTKNDDVPPIITMKGEDTLFHVLNAVYNDPGATATDETDGNVTQNIYIDNGVDVDRIGEYFVTYSVVDKAGNEAVPQFRVVYVYNQAISYYGNYQATDVQVYPLPDECIFPSYVWVDSTVNNRIVLLDFACNSQREVYADLVDTVLVMPYQVIDDSAVYMSLQGSGSINDSTIKIEYTRIDSLLTTYWNVEFNRLK